MMSLNISQKLYAGFGAIIGLMVLVAVLLWNRSNYITYIAHEVSSDNVPGVLLYLQVLDAVSDMQANVLEYLAGETGEEQTFRENYQKLSGLFEQLRVLESDNKEERDKLALINQLVSEYASGVEQRVFDHYDPDKERWAFSYIDKLEDETGAELEALLDRLKQEKFQQALKSNNPRRSLDNHLPAVRYYLELVDATSDLLSSLVEYASGEVDSKQVFAEVASSFQQYFDALKPLDISQQEVAELARINTLFSVIKTSADRVFSELDPIRRSQAIAAVDDMEHSLYSRLEEILEASAEEERVEATKALESTVTELDGMVSLLLISTLAAALLGAAIAFLLSASINRRLQAILHVANAVASGDLTSPALDDESNSDELSALAIAINQMSNSLNGLLAEINLIAGSVAESSQEMLASNQSMADDSSDQASKAMQIATAVEEMSATANEVAQQSVSAAANAQQSGERANRGGEIVHKTVASMNKISDMVTETATTIDNLGTKGAEIGEIIQVINSIAEQTNLLALNAAIEAARAGEQGRGFAVVADEVRTLAARTAAATQEVADSIGAIQNDTRIAVSRMAQGTDCVNDGVKLAQQAGEALTDIVEGATLMNTVIESIATAAEEQSATASGMAKDVSGISDTSAASVDITSKAAETASDMSNKAAQLAAAVSRFKLR